MKLDLYPPDRCIICDGPKKARFWVCKKCAVDYNLLNVPYSKWPEWVKGLQRIAAAYIDKHRGTEVAESFEEQSKVEQIIDSITAKNSI